MCAVNVIVQLVFIVHASASSVLRVGNRIVDELDINNVFVDTLVENVISRLGDRVWNPSRPCHAHLDQTTVEKPTSSHVSSQVPASCLPSTLERLRSIPNVITQKLAEQNVERFRQFPNIIAVKPSEQSTGKEQRKFLHDQQPTKVSTVVHRRFRELEARVVNHHLPHRVALAMGPDDGLPFSVAVEVLSPGSRTEMPVNVGYKLVFILSGSLETHWVRGEDAQAGRVNASAGDVVLFPPEQLHIVEVTDQRPCHMLTFILDAHVGAGSGRKAASEWVDWIRKGLPAGPLSVQDFQSMHPRWEHAPPQAAMQLPRNVTQDTLDWPMQRSPLKVKRKHIHNADGVAAVPTNALALIFHARQLPFNFALEDFAPGHITPVHKHDMAHEFFYILSGDGIG